MSALGLGDLVAAMPHAAAVLDRAGAVIVGNSGWDSIASELALLFPHMSIDLLDGESISVADQVASVGIDAGTRHVELRVSAIGESSPYLLATCLETVGTESTDDGWDQIDRHPVTGLPGRRLFLELLGQAMTMSDRHRYHPAALAVAVTGLDDVTADHGDDARAELTIAVAARLKAGLRPGDVVAQLSDDVFAVMLPDVDGTYLAEAVAHRLGAEVGRPFRLGSARAAVELFVGVATAEASKSPASVLASAESALEEAQAEGADDVNATRRVVVIGGAAPTGAAHPGQRHIDLTDLRDEALVSYFQPIFDLTDGRVVAGEALMRWRHPHYGVLSAGEFMGLAINSGLLATLTDQALVCSTETWADLRDRLGDRPPQLFVNLSPEQLLSRVAVDRLYHLLIATGLPPEDVVVEVTEEAMSTRFSEMLQVLTELRTHGLRVALDDFGSGYSSLGRLRHLPVDVIKVDQSMVRGLETDLRARQLLAAVSTMASELDVECIVEGIETAGEAAIVGDLGFRYVQGYHFARPCPADDFVRLVVPELAVG